MKFELKGFASLRNVSIPSLHTEGGRKVRYKRMQHSGDLLSPVFLRSRGVDVTQALSDWLLRVGYVSRSRSNPLDRQRYEYWVLNTIEDALGSGGVASRDWVRYSTTMPPNAEVRIPYLLSGQRAPNPMQHPNTTYYPGGASSQGYIVPRSNPVVAPPPPVDQRTKLFEECAMRCPGDLRPYLRQAFEITDVNLQQHKRTYDGLTFLYMMEVTQSIRNHYLSQMCAAPAPVPERKSEATTYKASVKASTSGDVYGREAHTASKSTVKRQRSRDASSDDEGEDVRRQRRTRRTNTVDTEATSTYFKQAIVADSDAPGASKAKTFVGVSEEMERAYSRDEPTPADIRPEHVLHKALRFIEKKAKTAGTKYLSDQLKGMRQDLRVQNIKSPFAIKVYERAAKVCLQMRDLGDFNQSQAALRTFYQLPFATEENSSIEEFTAYRLAYLALIGQMDTLAVELIKLENLHYAAHGASDADSEELQVNKQAVGPVRTSSCLDVTRLRSIHETVRVCAAVLDGDSFAVMRHFIQIPHGCFGDLLAIFLQRQRVVWLRDITSGIRGPLTSTFLLEALGFFPIFDEKMNTEVHVQAGGLPHGDAATVSNIVGSIGGTFLDGSLEKAEKELTELFAVLKMAPPDTLNLVTDVASFVNRTLNERLEALPKVQKKKGKGAGHHQAASIDEKILPPSCTFQSEVLQAAVKSYLEFLRTRKDANLDAAAE